MPTSEERLDRIVAHLTQPLGVRRRAAPKERKSWNGWKVGDCLEVAEQFFGGASVPVGTRLEIKALDSTGMTMVVVPTKKEIRWTNKELASRLFRKVPRRSRPASGTSTSSSRSRRAAKPTL